MSQRKAKNRSRRYVTAVICVSLLAVSTLVCVVSGAAWGRSWSGTHEASEPAVRSTTHADSWSVSQPRPLRSRPIVRCDASQVTIKLGQTARMSGSATSPARSVQKVTADRGKVISYVAGTWEWQSKPAAVGQYTVTVTATDSAGRHAHASFAVTVRRASQSTPADTPTTRPSPTTKPSPIIIPSPTTKPSPIIIPSPTTKPSPIVIPSPTTKPSPIIIPSPTPPPPTTPPLVIDGHLDFGSNLAYSNVTIKGGLSNAAGAHDTTFTNCRILGTGQSETFRLGDSHGGCWNIRFVNCTFARPDGSGNLATLKPLGSKPSSTNGLHDISFEDCHFGVANSAGKTGANRMLIEIQNYSTGAASHGFSNVNFIGCTFEAAGNTTLDYAGTQQGYAGGTILDGNSLVKDCLFKGYSYLEDSASWTGCLTLEMVRNVRVQGNTFWRGWAFTISSSTRAGAADQATNNVITGNTFDFRVDTGIAQKRAGFARTVLLDGKGDTLTNNTVYLPAGVTAASDLWSSGGTQLTLSSNSIAR